MSLRPPGSTSAASLSEISFDALGYEILAEKAASLGRAGKRAETCVKQLKEHRDEAGDRAVLVKQTADAVYAWFIQRELCGFRRHDDIIREHAIPKEVLVRLGAR